MTIQEFALVWLAALFIAGAIGLALEHSPPLGGSQQQEDEDNG